MGLFGHEYKKYYSTQSSPINEPYTISDSLSAVMWKYTHTPECDLNLALKDAQVNSITGTLWKVAKNCRAGKRYADTIGTPEGTLIVSPLSLTTIKTFITNPVPTEIVSQTLAPCNSNTLLAMCYEYIVKEFSFDGTYLYMDLSEITKKTKKEITPVTYVQCSLSTTNKIIIEGTYESYHTTYGSQGPKTEKTTNKVSYETDVVVEDPNATYLVIQYNYAKETQIIVDSKTKEEKTIEVDKYTYFWYNTSKGTIPIVDRWIANQKCMHYPSFLLRTDYTPMTKDYDAKYVKDAKRCLNRINLDFEDIVNNVNGLQEVNGKGNNEEEYQSDLGHCTDIALTFALDVAVNDQRVMRYMFEFFKFMYESSGYNANSISYKHKAYSYTCSWNKINYSINSGSVCKNHKFTSEGTTSRRKVKMKVPVSMVHGGMHYQEVETYKNVTILRIRKQIDRTHYAEIEVEDYNYTNYNNGKGMSNGVPTFSHLKPYTHAELEEIKNSDDEDLDEKSECLIPVLPIIIRKRMGGILGGDILFISMRIVHNTYQKIKKKWYQTKWFAVIRIVVSIIIIIFTWGSATPYVIAANAAVNLAINILIQVLIAMAIKLATKMIIKIFHIEGIFANILNTVSNAIQMCCYPANAGMVAFAQTMAEVCTSGKLDVYQLADNLSAAAGSSLMAVNPVAGFIYTNISNPQFYYAIQTKDWCKLGLMVGMSALQAWAISNSSANFNSQGVSINSVDDLFSDIWDRLTNIADGATSPGNVINKGVGLVTSQLDEKAQRIAAATQQLIENGNTLFNHMILIAAKANSALAYNNAQMLGFVLDNIYKDNELDSIKFDGKFNIV